MRDMVSKFRGVEATQKGYSDQRARDADIRLAQRAINGNAPGLLHNALWFFRPVGDCPDTRFNQQNSGRYRAHSFFSPSGDGCPEVYSG